jgi:pimeloyl-ACP methyl ester carboxylesterase
MTSRKLVLSVALLAGLAGGVFVVDRRATAHEDRANAAFPPQGQIIMVDGLQVHAYVAGSGPDLILIHGASGNLRDFTFALIPRLTDRYRVIAFDRPGLGWSDPLPHDNTSPTAQAAHLRRAADQLGVANPIVLGHSYGGAVALAWALDNPDTGALVLVSAASMPWEGGIWYMHNVMGSTLGGWTAVPLISAFAGDATAEAATRDIFKPDAMPDGYLAHIGAALTMRRSTLQANSAQVAGLKPFIVAMRARYGELTLPVEAVHGDTDTIVPLHVHSRPLSELLPNVHLTVLPGTGHMPHHADATQVLAAIDRAAARAASTAGLHDAP